MKKIVRAQFFKDEDDDDDDDDDDDVMVAMAFDAVCVGVVVVRGVDGGDD